MNLKKKKLFATNGKTNKNRLSSTNHGGFSDGGNKKRLRELDDVIESSDEEERQNLDNMES